MLSLNDPMIKREIIMDHYENPRNKGLVDDPRYIKVNMNSESCIDDIDIQKEYEKEKSKSIGLKNLEKQFGIIRETEVISGSNLAKTFHKVMKDKDYISRMPREKVEKILLYNEQDVVNLYHIFINWNKYINNPFIEEKISEVNIENNEENKDEVRESL